MSEHTHFDQRRAAIIDEAQIIKLRGGGLFVASSPADAASMLKALGYVVIEPLAIDAWAAGLCSCPVCGEGQVAQ